MEDKYQEALERAKPYYPDNLFLDTIFPELRDSEDERIRKELIAFLRYYYYGQGDSRPFNKDWISWLEKQKENPKTAISISADCASNAKCEDRGEIPQEFIDFLGARYQSMDTYYSDCSALAKMDAPSLWAIAAKYFKEVNPPAPFDDKKQKEQRLSTEETELNSIAFLEELGYTCIPPHSLAGCVDDKMVLKKLEASAKEYYKRNYEGGNPQGKGVVIQSYIDGASEWLEQKEQKPCGCVNVESEYDKGWRDGHKAGLKDSEQKPEWGEEDEKILDSLIRLYSKEYSAYAWPWANGAFTYGDVVNFLKSLRPDSYKNCNSHWKPSEEQMKHLERCFSHGHTSQLPNQHVLESLYNDLKKL